VTRQPELFFDAPLDFPVTPVFAAFEEGFYGFPVKERVVKVADHNKGPLVTRFDVRPPVTSDELRKARSWLRRRMPALADRPLARHRICLYDNTADDHFLLARADGVVVAAGFSGHAFKFAPALGEQLADMAGKA
jgi:glycine/D-amino acid oxidase-like deaminating enzyme